MPKAGDVTFSIEPIAVLEAAQWLFNYRPYSQHASSLLLSALTPDQIEAREMEWNNRVVEATIPLLDWVRRRKRIERHLDPMPLCLDRRLVHWLGNFAPTSNGGLFGGQRRGGPISKSPKTQAAMHFFSACRVASSRRVGRPRLSKAEALDRLVHTEKLSTTTLWRMVKLADDRLPDIQGLLAAFAAKTP